MKQEKGIGGMSILLSVVTSIFIAGILIALFAITGAEMMDATDDATAIDVINDSTIAIGDTVDWFPIIITVGAVVVVIALIAIVITAIRGTGFLGGA